MDTTDILKATDAAKRLIQDENYYKYIFKKTERIVSVVFYILNSVPENGHTKLHIEDIQHAARATHDAVLQSLETRAFAAEDIVRGVAHALVALDSKLSVAQVAGVMSPEVYGVFQNEIDSVLRTMSKYIGDDSDVMTFATQATEPAPAPQKRAPVRTPQSVGGVSAAPTSQPGRRERIKTILEAKGEASIKDISSIITDVSEKTIQRELQSMIEDNVVKKQGERRWSKYSLF